MRRNKEERVLLHSCCAICSGHPITLLKEIGFEPIVYFFNPNIYPESEYFKRLEAQQKLCKKLDCALIVEDYKSDLYEGVMVGYENHKEGSERCKRCFELRLLKTVFKAKEMGIKNWDTTISISPHKNYNLLREIGENFYKFLKVNYLGINYKKQDGLLKSNLIAKSMSLYRQNYCGCENSMKQSGKSEEEVINWLANEVKIE